MKGLASIAGCTYYGKPGHNEKECWKRHPKNTRVQIKHKNSPPKPKECWECEEVGHVRRHCPHRNKSRPHISAAIKENLINENVITNYIDSASSIHLVTSLNFLTDIREVTPVENMQAVGGELIQLTHKGKRTVMAQHGTLQLSEVYYAEGVTYNLISAPKLVERGVSLHLTKMGAYIEKQGDRIICKRKVAYGPYTQNIPT